MIKEKVALVLGAGSSIPFGYPVGSELRRRILTILHPENQELAIRAGLYDHTNASCNIHAFVGEFRKSQMTSIDAFLARRPEFSEIGKLVIAAVLLGCEKQDHLWACEHDDLWQRYFFGRVAAEKWEDLDFGNISIITFNYDRSFEHYILSALQGSYGKSENEAVEKLKTLNIVHAYGSLGPTLPSDPGYFHYGKPIDREIVRAAAQCLKVIPEGRDDDVSLRRAQNLLYEADAIGFLGFGFDETNLRRLKADITCSMKVKRGDTTIHGRRIIATCRGMTMAEAHAAFNRLGDDGISRSVNRFPPNFFSCGSFDLLRECLILGEWPVR